MVADKTIIDVAKRNIEKFDIVPLYYDMKKADAVILDKKSIYAGLNAAFVKGNIGIYSNNISKIWNSDVFINGSDEDKENAINIIKLLCCENNFCIDAAKTLYMPERPKDVNNKVNAFTNQPLPHFFKYAKDKTDSQVVDINESFVNKLESIIPNPRINTRKLGLGQIDPSMLMHDPDIEFDVAFTSNGRVIEEETDPLIVEYCKFDKMYYMNVDSAMCSGKVDKNDHYMKTKVKNDRITSKIKEALSKFGYTEREVADILVKFLYGMRKSSNKTALWLCYGDIIYENLSEKIHMSDKEVQCPDCGEWFTVPFRDNRTTRCPECSAEHKREMERLKKQRQRERKKAEMAEI